MTTQQAIRYQTIEPRRLDRSRRRFLLARAQLAAGDAEPLRREAARRRWRPHRRRFT